MDFSIEKEGKASNTKTKEGHSELNFSKTAVQRAGEALMVENISVKKPDVYEKSMQILSGWRASHEYSLNYIAVLVQKTAIKEDSKVIVAKRLKRTPSIVNKLRRFETMKLRSMQDIAGCRAIISTNKNVYKVFKKLSKTRSFRVTDYIEAPKDDGYRGIHLICKCGDKEHGEKGAKYPVEIQLRSKIQHSWATAVEIVDLFTNQVLKSNDGKKDWLDFFKYISHEFSKIEGIDNKPISNSLSESIRLIKKLDIHKKFEAYTGSLDVINKNTGNIIEGYSLIKIDFEKKTIQIWGYPYNDFDKATSDFLKLEKEAEENKKNVVALVSSKSISNLKEAYPNYFADSKLFIKKIREIENNYIMKNPHWLLKMMSNAGFKSN